MPIYQFVCKACNTSTDKYFDFTAIQAITCKCGEEMEKVIGVVGVIFKGNGWGGQ